MDPFTADYLANLTADLTAQALAGTGRRLREALSGDEEQQALCRCVQAGLVALLAQASSDESDALDLLAEIFRDFFQDEDVGRELAALLRGNPLDGRELAYLFEGAGYEAGTLPGLDFQQGLAAFQSAFLAAATEEPALQGILQTGQLLIQTRLQREMAAAMRKLVAFLRQARLGSVGIQADRITAQNVVSGLQIVYQMPRVAVPAPPGDWEGHYLRTLMEQCDPLDLTPIDPAHPLDAEPVRISDVFTTLYLERLTRAPDQPLAEAILRPLVPGREELPRREEEERIPVQAVEAVAALPRLVILGGPGSGKSTLVNHIVTQLARRRLGEATGEGKLPGWPADGGPLPVRIILRRFAAWLPDTTVRGDAGLVWDYLEHQLRRWGCREACDALARTLKGEGGAVFFDGLDEVRETDEGAKRSLIKEAIAAFAAPLDKCKVIVTCREYAYKQGDAWRLPDLLYPDVELAPFDLAQVEAFTRTWYRVVGPQKGWDEKKCQDEARNLYEAVQTWPHLQELAQYPLLLTLMAQVHGRDGSLPQDRADLYKGAVDLLLAHWANRIVRDVDGGSRVEPGLVMQLGVRTETLREALERVAFAAHERQEREEGRGERAADIPREDLRDELERDLGSVDQADIVIAYIQERAGLLQARDNRTYAFPHRTFQEYLAATHILKQGDFDLMLCDRVRRDLGWWQEVFLLAAGASRGTPRNISDLVDCLLPSLPEGTPAPVQKAAEAQLAAQALWETGFARYVHQERVGEPGRYTATQRRVQAWLVIALRSDASLPTRERAASGDALARLGDPRPGVGQRPDGLPDIVWCQVPAGRFTMGSDRAKDPEADDDELPQDRLTLPDYRISRYPVTNAQYAAFVSADGYGQPRYWTQAGWCWRGDRTGPETFGGAFDLPNHPVVMVTWYEAVAFGRWVTGRLRDTGDIGQDEEVRLPSEAEWEMAARGEYGRIYPWGYEFDSQKCNVRATGIGTTSAVGIFPGGASPYGVQDMSGNVDEWCGTRWRDSYKESADEMPEGDFRRVVRGGSFDTNERRVRCAYRGRSYPGYRGSTVGLRVVVAPVTSAR